MAANAPAPLPTQTKTLGDVANAVAVPYDNLGRLRRVHRRVERFLTNRAAANT